MGKFISETKILDILHSKMPSSSEAASSNAKAAVLRVLEDVANAVRKGEADDEIANKLYEGELEKAGIEPLPETEKSAEGTGAVTAQEGQ